MRSTRRAWLAAIATTGALAGCLGGDEDGDGDGGESGDDAGGDGSGDDGGGDGGGDGGDSGGDDGDDTDGEMDGEAASFGVAEHDEYGELLVDEEGMVLYMFDSDAQGEGASTCYDDCEDNWPPVTVQNQPSAGDGIDAELTTFEREDGSMQVAADGWPLYYFAGDSQAGQANGQAVGGVWWALRPDGTPVRPDVQVAEHDEHGEILVDAEGTTLYQFDSDTQGEGASTCYDGCESNWPPLTVEDGPMPGADVTAELTTFEREDGSMQVAADGWPLYYWANDDEPGDATGQGVNDVWWVLRPDGTVVRD